MDRWIIKNKQKNSEEQNKTKTTSILNLNISAPSPQHIEARQQNLKKSTEGKKLKNVAAKRNYYKFNTKWLENESFKFWLRQFKGDEKFAFCKVCNDKIVAHKIDIKRHSGSNKHKTNLESIKNMRQVNKLIETPLDIETRRAETKITGLLATNNLSFLLVDSLVPLLKDIFPDSLIAKNLALKRTKATAIMTNLLGTYFSSDLYNKIGQKETYFSLVIDETTDQSTTKQCAFVVLYYNHEINRVDTIFLEMKEVTDSGASGLFKLIKDCLDSNKIPMHNLIGFASDTPNVMVGQKHSVFSLLKEEIPHIVCVKCSCHLIHLVASKACLHLPTSIEDLLRNLGSYFNRSYIRKKELKEFQLYFQAQVHKILSPSVTRWLSIKQCVDRVLEQYEVLNSYLRLQIFEDPSKITRSMLQTMDAKVTKIYLEFLSYVLGLFTEFNILFQSERPLLHKLKPEIKNLLMTLCSNYLNINYVKSSEDILKLDHTASEEYVPLKDIYVGIAAKTSLSENENNSELSEEEATKFYEACLHFYKEAVNQIKSRFSFEDEIFDLLEIVDPKYAQSFKIKSLLKVSQRLFFLEVNQQSLDNEWRMHAFLDHEIHGLLPTLPVDVHWKKVFELKNAANMPLFENLKKVITLLLILPFSNACVERVFSSLKNCKTDHRNELKTETISAIFSTKYGIENKGGIEKFEPGQNLLKSSVWHKKEF